jgi:hypothetical protein
VSHLLWMTLGDCPRLSAPRSHLRGRRWRPAHRAAPGSIARCNARLSTAVTFNILPLPKIGAKLWQSKRGSHCCWKLTRADLFHIRDGDGDHAIAEVPALVRAALHLTDAYGHSNVIVIGARRSRHHPMVGCAGSWKHCSTGSNLDVWAYTLRDRGVRSIWRIA